MTIVTISARIILATARSEGATLWTRDADFEGLEGVEYRAGRQRNLRDPGCVVLPGCTEYDRVPSASIRRETHHER